MEDDEYDGSIWESEKVYIFAPILIEKSSLRLYSDKLLPSIVTIERA